MAKVIFSDKSNIAREDKKSCVLGAIRRNCLECCGGSSEEVRYCSALDCQLWPYRFGKTPRQVKERALLNRSAFAEGGRFDIEKPVKELAA